MIRIKPIASKDHLKYKISNGYLFTGGSKIRLTDESFADTATFDVGKSALIFAKNALIGVLTSDSIAVYDIEGKLLQKLQGSYAAAGFDNIGRLYTASRIDKENISIAVFDESLNLVAKADIEDELYDSALTLAYMPVIEAITLELAAGQDGSVSYGLNAKNGKITKKEIFDSLIMPAFTSDIKHYAAIDNDSSTWKYMTYPKNKEQAEIDPYEIGMFEDVEGNLEYTLIHVKDDTFVVGFCQRYFLMDFAKSEITDELIIEGHEPRPTYEIFPSLKGNDTLITDIVSMEEAGDCISAYTEKKECFYFPKSALKKD